jgi:NADH:ubiquinone reductase (H+-translocating)
MSARVLVLGGGFGGVYVALELERLLRRRDDVEVTLVTRENFLLFTPMLHEVAAGELEPSTIVEPLRKLLRRVDVFVGDVERIELAARRVRVVHGADGHGHELPYDHLVLALGSVTNFFGLPGVARHAHTMKSIDDALALRNRVIAQLEEAGSECAAGARHPLLTFVVAGGGFAGVETLGGLNDFVHELLPFYPTIRPDLVRMVLVTPDELVLPELGPSLGRYAQRKLEARGVEIVPHCKVASYHDRVVGLSDGRTIPACTLVWTAGTAPNPLLASLDVPKERGRVRTDACLRVAPGVWAAGDCAAIPDPRTGGFHPPTAQHAIREARALARNLVATLDGGAPRPFRFSTLGQLAAIGRRTGVARVFGMRFSGFVAWWLWRTLYLAKLPRFEKRVRVALDWTVDLAFAKDFACFADAPRAAEARAPSAA